MKARGPPILPMYKASSNQKKKGGGLIAILIAVLLPIIAVFLLVFFFLSIYMGSSYLQEHLQDGTPGGLLNNIGLPNTRNNIQKWSIDHLHGVDITKLGPPPKVIPQGLGSLYNQHRYNISDSLNAVNAGLSSLTHRIGDTISQIYYTNNSSSSNSNTNSSATAAAAYTQMHQGSAKLSIWLKSFADLKNVTIPHELDAHRLRTYISNTTDRAVRGIAEYGSQGVRGMSELGQRGVRSMRGAVGSDNGGGGGGGGINSEGGDSSSNLPAKSVGGEVKTERGGDTGGIV